MTDREWFYKLTDELIQRMRKTKGNHVTLTDTRTELTFFDESRKDDKGVSIIGINAMLRIYCDHLIHYEITIQDNKFIDYEDQKVSKEKWLSVVGDWIEKTMRTGTEEN